jgi:heptosyltransferase-2
MTDNTRKNILVRAPNWLGDNVLCLPAVNVLRAALPDARLTVMVKKSMAGLWEMADVDAIIPFTCARSPMGLIDRLKLASVLKKQAFDTAIIFPNSFDSALVPWLARIPERIGWPTQGRAMLINRKITYPHHLDDRQQWERDVYLVTEGLGCSVSADGTLRIEVPVDTLMKIAAESAGLHKPLIAVNPGATYGPAKCWLPERYVETALRINKELQGSVIIVGGPGDVPVCEDIYTQIVKQDNTATRWCRSLAGKTNVTELAGWLEQCVCTVTNDTGGMHISAAVGTPVAAIFGPTNWNRTAPLGEGHQLIKATVDCERRCKRTCVADHRCMKSVTVEMVMEAVMRLAQCESAKV